MWGKEKRNRKKLPRTKVVEVECWNRTVETGIVIGKVMQWDARIRRSGGWWANNRISELVGSFVCQPYIFQMHVYWNQWVPGYTTISCEYNLCRRRKCAPSAPEGCDFFYSIVVFQLMSKWERWRRRNETNPTCKKVGANAKNDNEKGKNGGETGRTVSVGSTIHDVYYSKVFMPRHLKYHTIAVIRGEEVIYVIFPQ